MSVIDQIVGEFKYMETDDTTLMINEGGNSVDLFQSAETDDLFSSFVKSWQDPEKRKEYETLKETLSAQYSTDPAKFVGYIEESSDMFKDIIAAANETGADPNFLYNVAMQEGLAEKLSAIQEANVLSDGSYPPTPIYESDRSIHSFTGIGLDVLFLEQDEAVRREYLDSPIKPSEKIWAGEFMYNPDDSTPYGDQPIERTYGDFTLQDTLFHGDPKPRVTMTGLNQELMMAQQVESWYSPSTGEKGLQSPAANITSKDALRGIGATIRLNQDYMKHYFKKEGLDFNELSSELKDFWTYASINAGAGTTSKLLQTYGSDPYSNPKFRTELTKQQQVADEKEFLSLFPGYEGKDTGEASSLAVWMENVIRVTGGTQLTELYSPFSK